ncbi:histidinol-phosphate transaminase [Streptomyces sp. ISL-11]|uniref:histidinol-phosphate transaminase n=1 Tax=Streptomyces sp. ISL-11 TaxID=2819174 RepID=UPI001BE81B7B|nr:histidinol-phosphate transaminase [Streptomyces sp. ISL-11]MBT2383998.1 histidinol-phosphate transaminase [Streptomyces sp. ISL-11]
MLRELELRLHLNENPYPPLPEVRDALAAELDAVNRYPEFTPETLVTMVAQWLGVAREQVAVGSGSVGIALQVLDMCTGPGDQVIYGWRSFDAYPLITRMAGAEPVEVALTPTGEQDLDGMLAAVTHRTRVVVLCNPHNPTGTTIGRPAMERFLAALPDRVTVVLDEAYHEFSRDPGAADGLDHLADHPNVVVLRTFSKAYGLAALRVGYAVAAPATAGRVRDRALPFGIGRLAQVAVAASLRARAQLADRVDAIVAERDRLRAELTRLGWSSFPSHGNFLWLDAGARSEHLAAALSRAGALVRCYPGEGLRLTVGSREADDLVLRAAGSVASGTTKGAPTMAR